MPDVPKSAPSPAEKPAPPSPSSSGAVSPNPLPPVAPAVQPKAAVPPSPAVPTVPASAPPKAIGKETASVDGKKRFLFGCFGGFMGLFVVFVGLMVLVLSQSGLDNPVLRSLNLDAAGLRSFLLGVVGISFGMVSLVLLVLMVLGIFRFAGAKKTDKEKRSNGIRMAIFSLIPLVIVLSSWLLLFNFVNRLTFEADRVVAEILVVEPSDLSSLVAPVEVTFSSLNVARALEQGGLSLQKMEWDLDGDGRYETPVTQPQVVQLYRRRGITQVGLRVYLEGESAPRTFTRNLSIQDATFSASPDNGTAPLSVSFDASDLVPANAKIQSFDWDFDGDGRYDLQGDEHRQASFVFRQIGEYNVHLRFLNAQGNVENYYKAIEVVPSQTPLLGAEIDASPGFSGTLPFQVRFDADRSFSLKGKLVDYTWDFGDGSPLQKGKSVSHVFEKNGEYQVELTVREDSSQTAQNTATVTVGASASAPQASIVTVPASDPESGQLLGDAPFKVAFDASASFDPERDIVQYGWDFDGDGKDDKFGQKAEFTFDKPGEYAVRLRLEDAQGQSGEAVLRVLAQEPGLKALIKAEPQEGVAPLMVSFDGSSSTVFEGSIVSYEWSFGDGTASAITGASLTHQYAKPGTYPVSLKVTSNQGETAQASTSIFVRETPLEACFVPSRKSGPAPLRVTFDVKCSSGTIAKYEWDFGDGSAAASYNPSHSFVSPGVYSVTLKVFDAKSNVATYSDTITAEGPLAN